VEFLGQKPRVTPSATARSAAAVVPSHGSCRPSLGNFSLTMAAHRNAAAHNSRAARTNSLSLGRRSRARTSCYTGMRLGAPLKARRRACLDTRARLDAARCDRRERRDISAPTGCCTCLGRSLRSGLAPAGAAVWARPALSTCIRQHGRGVTYVYPTIASVTQRQCTTGSAAKTKQSVKTAPPLARRQHFNSSAVYFHDLPHNS
jgi:hypothetical protein